LLLGRSGHVRFTPKTDIGECDSDVRFVPITEIAPRIGGVLVAMVAAERRLFRLPMMNHRAEKTQFRTTLSTARRMNAENR
jgi:hypothetical protein